MRSPWATTLEDRAEQLYRDMQAGRMVAFDVLLTPDDEDRAAAELEAERLRRIAWIKATHGLAPKEQKTLLRLLHKRVAAKDLGVCWSTYLRFYLTERPLPWK
jgi:hypothetical protein